VETQEILKNPTDQQPQAAIPMRRPQEAKVLLAEKPLQEP